LKLQPKNKIVRHPSESGKLHHMVNSELEIYLTDFQESIFAGKNAKYCGFCGGEIFEDPPIYQSGIKCATAL